MPIITIKTPYPAERLCLKTIVEAVNADTGIEMERLNVLVEPYSPQNYYNINTNQRVIVHVEASIHNGKETIQTIMSTVCRIVREQLNIEEDQIAVYAHPIEDGYLLFNKKYK